MDWKNRKILITGGLGFIGSNLAARLLELGADVTIVDSLVPEYGGNLFNVVDIQNNVSINISDVRDEFSLQHLVKGKDVLFNLAGQTSHLDSMADPKTDLEINCCAQLSILEACRKQNPGIKILFASTRQVYGRPDYLPVDEKHPIRPVDVNGINKVAGEQYHILYNNIYGLQTCVLRLTNTYGPHMRVKDARQTFLGVWIKQILSGEPFEVWEGGQLRDFTYINDCIDAMLLVAGNPDCQGSIFNLGGAEPPITLQKLAELLVEVNRGGTFQTMSFPTERKCIDIGDYYSDMGLLERRLDWHPKVKLCQGLTRTLDYYKKHLCHYL